MPGGKSSKTQGVSDDTDDDNTQYSVQRWSAIQGAWEHSMGPYREKHTAVQMAEKRAGEQRGVRYRWAKWRYQEGAEVTRQAPR